TSSTSSIGIFTDKVDISSDYSFYNNIDQKQSFYGLNVEPTIDFYDYGRQEIGGKIYGECARIKGLTNVKTGGDKHLTKDWYQGTHKNDIATICIEKGTSRDFSSWDETIVPASGGLKYYEKYNTATSLYDVVIYTDETDVKIILNNADATDAAFKGFSKLGDISGLDKLYTTTTIDMTGLFKDSPMLTDIDISCFDMTNATTFTDMFDGCAGLTTLIYGEPLKTKINDIGLTGDWTVNTTDTSKENYRRVYVYTDDKTTIPEDIFGEINRYTGTKRKLSYDIGHSIDPKFSSIYFTDGANISSTQIIQETPVVTTIIVPGSVTSTTEEVFDKWCIDAAFTTAFTSLTMNADKTLYAKYDITTYDIPYDIDGGTWDAGYTYPTKYNYIENLTLPDKTKLTKAGYLATDWTVNNVTYTSLTPAVMYQNFGATPKKPLKIKWAPVQYTIAYNVGGHATTPASTTKTYGIGYTVPTPTGI
ncbi:MAG: hypothetical protein MJ151_03525, partial [Lachnospiraceae bacterium]|nr:hypothetical protein [Lachnospiraceae bacterium]